MDVESKMRIEVPFNGEVPINGCYSTISISDAIVPSPGQDFRGNKDVAFNYVRVSSQALEGATSSTPSSGLQARKGAYFVGYPGIFDVCRSDWIALFHQRPALILKL